MEYGNTAGYAVYAQGLAMQNPPMGQTQNPPRQLAPLPGALSGYENRLRSVLGSLDRTLASITGPVPCDPNKDKEGQAIDGMQAQLDRIGYLISRLEDRAQVLEQYFV